MAGEGVSAEDEQCWLAEAGEPERIAFIRTERWITYPRAAAILGQMRRLLDYPRNSRMPSLLIIGESGIGKTQLDLKFCRDHQPRFDEESRRTVSPVVSVQMPAAPTDRLFYMTLLRAVGAVFSPRISTAEAMIMALRLYADLGVRMVIFDETHNMLSGTFRDQRRILTQLRYLSNELRVSVVCLGIDTARDAISGDPQLARRFSLVELPAWEVDADFRALVATLLRHLPLRGVSVLDTAALQTVIRSTRGNTARVFQLFGDLAVAAISSGESESRPRRSRRGAPLYMIGPWRDERMSRLILPPRPPGPLPEIPFPETDEILSSWLTRSAALYHARPEALLEQVGLTELSPPILDRHGTSADLERLAVALRSSPPALYGMSFAGQPREALELVAHNAPLWTCHPCTREFASRALDQIKLRQWFIAVASSCRRCGRQLSPARIRNGRALREIVAAGEFYELHASICEKLARAFEDDRPLGAVMRAMKALAAPVPTKKQVRYIARNRRRLPIDAGGTPPLLWQLVGMRPLRGHAHNYRNWRPPASRPYAAWPPAGQILATAGLNVLTQAGMAMWGLLRDLGLVEPGDELVVKNILADAG